MNDMVEKIANDKYNPHQFKLVAYDTSEKLREEILKGGILKKTLAGIQFPDDFINITKLPDHISFALSFPHEPRTESLHMEEFKPPTWRTNLLFPTMKIPGPRNKGVNDGGFPPGYWSEKFLKLQHEISTALERHLMKRDGNAEEIPYIQLQRFPYPAYESDVLLIVLNSFIALIFMLSFVYTCINTVKGITTEKERQLKVSGRRLAIYQGYSPDP